MANTYITRTNGSAATNHDKATISFWLKRCRGGVEESVFGAYVDDNNRFKFRLRSDDKFDFEMGVGGSWYSLISNRKLRDRTGWMHIVIAYDSTQATASNRTKIYINGSQVTDLGTANYVPQNQDFYFTKNGVGLTIGDNYQGGSHQNYFDGLLSHFHCVDGLALTPNYFGQTDSTSGEWKLGGNQGAITYGNNGFFILKDSASLTDQSGNGNNWSSGGGNLNTTLDNPSNNFCTWNGNSKIDNGSTSYGLLRITGSGATEYSKNGVGSIAAAKGKYYCEVKYTSTNSNTNPCLGICNMDAPYQYDINITTGTNGYINMRFDGELRDNNSGTSSWGPTINSNGDIIMMAMDLDNWKWYFGVNGTWANSANPSAGTGAVTIQPQSGYWSWNIRHLGATWDANFGNGFFGTTAVSSAGTNASGFGTFEYDVPTGFTALCTKGINSF